MAPDESTGEGNAGRFGARYGRIARKRVADIEDQMNDDHACPECDAPRVSRTGTGIWECAACDHKFAGGTFRPATPAGQTVERSIQAALADEDDE